MMTYFSSTALCDFLINLCIWVINQRPASVEGRISAPPISHCPISAMSLRPARCRIGLFIDFSRVIGADLLNNFPEIEKSI